ncbi:hypothetical protein [Formosa sp. PL04]|uniref:hypothetical protein n=1 Tax=Formosa sp. PL04 TaxID=3081755 RepID=UPI00298207AC|nr:hypothetical protein [Formosa sp. PL04]MDW5288269.1 hypothetical protein [Formosa sp. PL04]
MKNQLLLLFILLCSVTINAQKIINNPDYISSNINGNITQVELTDTETILHVLIKSPVGSWIAIPKETYIEDASGKSKRLFITKTDGISLTGKNYIKDSDEIRFKLYFPPLEKTTTKINYGESNKGGNWFIYKLDLSKDGVHFIGNSKKISNYSIVTGYPATPKTVNGWKIESGIQNPNQPDTTFVFNMYKLGGNNSLLPTDLPESFFGNWYDKYGTLILISTPDYLVSDYRVQYYRDIQQIGDNKFNIISTMKSFEVLNIDSESMTIRTDRLITLKRKPSTNSVPKFIKGDWLHWQNKKEIKVTDDYFYNNDHGELGVHDVVKSRIDQVVESESGNVIWFVLYHEGNYNLYSVRKTDGEYILQPRGFTDARYKKI